MDKTKVIEILRRNLSTLESLLPVLEASADVDLCEALELDIELLQADIEAIEAS